MAGANQGDRVEGLPRASQLLLEVHPRLHQGGVAFDRFVEEG